MRGYQRRKKVHLYYAGDWNKQTQTEFYEKKLNLHRNFVDVVQSKRTNLADGNDNIADQARDRKSTRLNSSHPSISRMPSSA